MNFNELTEDQIKSGYLNYLQPAIIRMCQEQFDGMPPSSRSSLMNYSLYEAVLKALFSEQEAAWKGYEVKTGSENDPDQGKQS